MFSADHFDDVIRDEPIRYFCDVQLNWDAVLAPLKVGSYKADVAHQYSIQGDAPKCLVWLKEFQPGRFRGCHHSRWTCYIAKVGSKFYPNESVTEHLLTRVGQECGLEMAESQVRMVRRQVRFLSKYFLKRGEESLVHGFELFQHYLGDSDIVREISARREEKSFYTFQSVLAAITATYPEHQAELMEGMVKLLVFDALVGNNDRHPLNWGVIVPVRAGGSPRFSPIYDSARGLFWNVPDKTLSKMSKNSGQFDAYLKRAKPQITWDGRPEIDHFELVGALVAGFPVYNSLVASLIRNCPIDRIRRMVKEEFGTLKTKLRVAMIQQCLTRRHEMLLKVVEGVS